MSTPERCFKCEWWNFTQHKCGRILKGRLKIAHGGGELHIETQPGLIPDYLEHEFEEWLADAITQAVDSWPGWSEVQKLREKNGGCAAEKENLAIKNFGSKLSLVKPLVEPRPDRNLDCHGLFKSDISLW